MTLKCLPELGADRTESASPTLQRKTKWLWEGLEKTIRTISAPVYVATALALIPMPDRAMAFTVADAESFQSVLYQAMTTGSGDRTLTYTGERANLHLDLASAASGGYVLPGRNTNLTVNLRDSTLYIDSGTLTVGEGSLLQIGSTGQAHLEIGAPNTAAELHINGGEMTFGARKTGQFRVAYEPNTVGTLRITNGGTLHLGTEEEAAAYTGFFMGYNGGDASLLLNNGSIVLGNYGASMRFGISANATIVLENGSALDSSLAASHLRVGEYAGGTATMLVDNSTIIIRGGGTASDADQRDFMVGASGGHGIFTQRGDDSLVDISGIYWNGIGSGIGGYGEYNLEGGRFIMGREDALAKFEVGARTSANSSEAYFNISGGSAKIWGNMEIGAGGGTSTVNGESVTSYATGAVTLTGGSLDVSGQIKFGRGIGSLNLNGGILVLNSATPIVGTTTSSVNFNGGTLSTRAAVTTISHDATIGERGAIIETLEDKELRYTGVLSGQGGLRKIGEGDLVLGAVNTYLGDTIVQAGQLTFDQQLNAVSGLTVYEDARFNLGAGVTQEMTTIAGGGDISLGHGATLGLGATDASSEFYGSILGHGTLRKSGSGTLTWVGIGETTSSGQLSLDAGRLVLVDTDLGEMDLQIAGGASLSGSAVIGSISAGATNGGVIEASGDGSSIFTLMRDSSLAGLTYQISASSDGAQNDQIISDGIIELSDANLQINFAGSGFDQTRFYTVLSGSELVGDFAGITDDLLFYDIVGESVWSGDLHSYEIGFVRNDLTIGTFAASPNQQSLAAALDGMPETYSIANRLQRSAGNELRTALGYLVTLKEEDIPAALDLAGGEIYAAAQPALIDAQRPLRDAVMGRLRFGDSAGEASDRPDIWAMAYGVTGSVNGSEATAEMDRSAGGLLAGAEISREDMLFGGMIGVGTSNFDLDARQSSGSTNAAHIGVYAGKTWGNLGLRLGGTYTRTDIDTQRSVLISSIDEQLAASFDAETLQFVGELGYTIPTGFGRVEPFAQLAHVSVKTHGYSEGDSAFALSGKGSSSNTNLVTLGINAAADFELAGRTVTAHGMLAWQHATGDLAGTATHNLNHGGDFTVGSVGLAGNTTLLEAGFDVQLAPATQLSIGYSGAAAGGSIEHRGQVGLSLRF